jgi:hypothetical protein
MSSLTPFADVEALVNQGCAQAFANALAWYTPTVGAQGREVPVTFDAQYATDLGDMVSGSSPALQCLAEALADMQEDARFVIRGVTYAPAEPQPDGTGWMLLRLRVVNA